MNIDLYINSSDYENVTKSLSDKKTISAVLKLDTSLTDPIFEISKNSYDKIYNYLYCQDFGRYYFIKSTKFLAGGIVQIECHVDVLMSNKEQLFKCECILERQERQANLYFNDNEFYALNKDSINTLKFPHSFTKNGAMILAVMGGN